MAVATVVAVVLVVAVVVVVVVGVVGVVVVVISVIRAVLMAHFQLTLPHRTQLREMEWTRMACRVSFVLSCVILIIYLLINSRVACGGEAFFSTNLSSSSFFLFSDPGRPCSVVVAGCDQFVVAACGLYLFVCSRGRCHTQNRTIYFVGRSDERGGAREKFHDMCIFNSNTHISKSESCCDKGNR